MKEKKYFLSNAASYQPHQISPITDRAYQINEAWTNPGGSVSASAPAAVTTSPAPNIEQLSNTVERLPKCSDMVTFGDHMGFIMVSFATRVIRGRRKEGLGMGIKIYIWMCVRV
ncbi:hypothetical protein HL42_1377 [Trichophyton rubrum]|nr:hypothetical protein HL42_1377 [Trichophyton rubrum]